MLLFFCIIGIILIVINIIIFSDIKILIDNLEIIGDSDFKIKYSLRVGIYFLGKIRLYSIKVNDKNVKDKVKVNWRKKLEQSLILKKSKIENIKSKKKIIKYLIKKLKVESVNLIIQLDTESINVTTYLIAIISSIIPLLLNKKIIIGKKQKLYYKVVPIYKNSNYLYVKLNSIISIKILYVIFFIIGIKK